MAGERPGLQAVGTIRRSRPPIAAGPPLIGVVTHELRGEPEPAWAPAPGRRERDLAPHRLSLRLTYTQAIQEAGGDRRRRAHARLRRRHGRARSTASTA